MKAPRSRGGRRKWVGHRPCMSGFQAGQRPRVQLSCGAHMVFWYFFFWMTRILLFDESPPFAWTQAPRMLYVRLPTEAPSSTLMWCKYGVLVLFFFFAPEIDKLDK